jgi:hypothetical protein
MRHLIAWLLALMLAPLPCVAQAASGAGDLIVEDLQCRGNITTSCAFILGHLYLNPTDTLDEAEIQNARLRLSSLRNFQSVDIYLAKGSQKGRAIVIVEVVEALPVANEWLFGTSARLDSIAQVFAGHVAYDNLFGSGKILDFTASTVVPISGPEQRQFNAALRYADPHVFGAKKFFAIASLAYAYGRSEGSDGSFGDSEAVLLSGALGRRLWDFSYVTLGYSYYPLLDLHSGRWQADGTFELNNPRNRNALRAVYGWDSEDDLYFPTRGSSFHVGFAWYFGTRDPGNELLLQYRQTWQNDSGSLWSIKIGGDPSPEYRQSLNESQALAIGYARPIQQLPFDDMRRGRWYLELGASDLGFRSDRSRIIETGLKAGVRLESSSFGLVDLYVLVSTAELR